MKQKSPPVEKKEQLYQTDQRTVTVVENIEKKKLLVYFSNKTSTDFRKELRAKNFSLSRKGNFWYSYLNDTQRKRIKKLIDQLTKQDRL